MRTRALAIVLGLLAMPACSVVGGDDTYEVTVDFPRAVSLYASSEVKVLGLGAGTVRSVTPDGDHVRVVLAIDEDVPVPADVVAAIVPQSLIGERHVQLAPAWTEGDDRLEDGAVIPIDRTVIPVEPDEALAALKEFLDAMDPDATGRLVTNAADALEGNGDALGDALSELADLNSTLAAKDAQLIEIVESFDELAATLVTREDQLGEVLDLFAAATDALADERAQIEALVTSLADLSTRGLDLVSRNAATLERDIEVLTTTLLSVESNLGAVRDLLSTSDDLPAGLGRAYDPEHRRIDLRTQFSPLVSEALDTVPGLPPAVCLPIDVDCEPLQVLGASAVRLGRPLLQEAEERSWAGRVADGVGAVGGFLGRSARGLFGL